jgi:hypothetical protein
MSYWRCGATLAKTSDTFRLLILFKSAMELDIRKLITTQIAARVDTFFL